ncbi:probable LRR receptor-like serine/threonine-protein kinase PAM74 [Beta vulgaris subsp. vulgaris]|uniref:probable LRR receptor-like serine/threonine-protein kinase PAM74 n=1 Tax=Beta vulgaris subsp. vulgaris TaxID=3555 RepID=UPI0020373007|nr:probable LRR receptor-like serine/threonine-protein kinase PAM74 [Beta vulgaris subsp. vulgaris]
MSIPIFILWVVSIPLSLIHADDFPAPRGFLVSCGSTKSIDINGLKYIPDQSFISVGNVTNVKNNTNQVFPILSELRFFPDKSARKSCYLFLVTKGAKYLIRTSYYYGNFDGRNNPPVFHQIVDGTRWSIVNTTEDYVKGRASYYEIVMVAQSKVLSICLARNEYTAGVSSPFISALEVMNLGDSLYKAVDLQKYALGTVARHIFGYGDGDNGEANFISYPDDEFHRMWQQFKDSNPIVKCQSNVTPSDFWNMPPSKALNSAITASRGRSLQIQWPPMPLYGNNYHISLYFQDNRTPSPYSWRVFNVLINGDTFYSKLNVTTTGVNVYSNQWPFNGQTQIKLVPDNGTPVGPVINAAEMFQLIPLGGKTTSRDVIAMAELARSLNNPPSDWSGDPCLPRQNSWSGVTCSQTKDLAQVASMNLTGLGLTGSLSTSMGNLSAIVHLWLGHNKLSGSLPDLSSMKMLQTLHLENNQFEGSIPESLSNLPNIREMYSTIITLTCTLYCLRGLYKKKL